MPNALRRLALLPVLSLGLVCWTGCQSPGERLDASALDQLHLGQPRAAVHKLFGPPAQTFHGANGRLLDRFWYSYDKPRMVFVSKHDGDVVARQLHVLYDAQLAVEKFKFYEGRLPYDTGWLGVQAGRPVPPETVERIRKGETRRPDLVAWMGQPSGEALNTEGDTLLMWVVLDLRALRPSETRELVVTLDAHEVVKDFHLSQSRMPY